MPVLINNDDNVINNQQPVNSSANNLSNTQVNNPSTINSANAFNNTNPSNNPNPSNSAPTVNTASNPLPSNNFSTPASSSQPNQANSPASSNTQAPKQPLPSQDDDSLTSFLDDWDDDPVPTSQKSTKSMSQEERIEMIKRVYKKVFLRDAEQKDINYYKYTNYSEEELINKLLGTDEFKKLMEQGKEYKKLLDKYEDLSLQFQNLQGQFESQQTEFKKLLTLLEEKNRHIQDLRKKLDDPYATGLCSVKPLNTNKH